MRTNSKRNPSCAADESTVCGFDSLTAQKSGRDEGGEITMFVIPRAHVPSKSVTNPSGRRKYQRVVLLHTLPDEVNIAKP